MPTLVFLLNNISVFIIFAGCLGLYFLRNEKNTYWYFFPVFLIILGILDKLGQFIPHGSINNRYYSYFVIPFQVLFYLWLYYKNNPKLKDVLIISLVFYLVSFLVEYIIYKDNPSQFFSSLVYLISNFILLIFILTYFFNLSTSNKILNFTRERMFWVSTGLLIFWLGTLPYFGLHTYLSANYFDLFLSYTWVVAILNYVMYSLFICSFIWGKKKS